MENNILNLKQIMEKMNEYTDKEQNYKDKENGIIKGLSKISKYNFDGSEKTDFNKIFEQNFKKYYAGVEASDFIICLSNFFRKMASNRQNHGFFARCFLDSDFLFYYDYLNQNIMRMLDTRFKCTKKSFLCPKNQLIISSVIENLGGMDFSDDNFQKHINNLISNDEIIDLYEE